jgi:PTS system nitrogen regulatory IIA component
LLILGISRDASPECAPMTLQEILSPSAILVGLKGETKEQIIEELVDSLEKGAVVADRDRVLQAVLEREKIMSTGIGDGIAIPHGKSDAVLRLAAALGIHRRGVDFEALDGEPAYVFFLLVSPANVSGPHIKALARISRLLKNDDFKRRLIAATTTADIQRIVEAEERDHPAAS